MRARAKCKSEREGPTHTHTLKSTEAFWMKDFFGSSLFFHFLIAQMQMCIRFIRWFYIIKRNTLMPFKFYLIFVALLIFLQLFNCCKLYLVARTHTRTASTLNAHKRSAMMFEYDWLTTAAKTSAFATKTSHNRTHKKGSFSAQQKGSRTMCGKYFS